MVEEIKTDWDYQVEVKDLKVVDESNGNVLRTRRAVVDANTNQVLGLVSPKFNIVSNRVIYDAVEEVKDELGLQLVDINVCRRKSVTVFKYKLDVKHAVEVKGLEKNDEINFGVSLINHFDSGYTGPKGGMAFAERLVCTNGMMLPKVVGRFSLKDLGRYQPEVIKNVLQERIRPMINTGQIWNEWAQTTPNRTKVGEFITSNVGKKVATQLLKDYDEGKDRSLWGLYNLVTYYITHDAKVRNIGNLPLKQYDLHRAIGNFYVADLN